MLFTCQDMFYVCHINSFVRFAVGQVRYPLCVCVCVCVCVCASYGCSRRTLSYGLCMCLKIYEALHFVPAQLDSHTRLLPLSSSRWLSLPPRSQRTTAVEPLHCVWSPKHFCPIVSGTAVLLLSPDCQSIVALSNFDSQEKFLGLSWHDWSLCWQGCTGSVTRLLSSN